MLGRGGRGSQAAFVILLWVRGPFLVCRILYYFCLIRRPWFKQGFGQSAAGAKFGPTDLPEGGHDALFEVENPHSE